jgi:tetratricopeptide (TPR) repeat protein
MFSISHLLEWANVQMLLAPFVILVVILVASRRFSDLRWDDRAWRYLSIVSLAGAGFVAAFNSDIGMSRDWDIMATMSAGLLVGSTGAIVTLAGSRIFRERIAWIVLSVTLLHTVPWILLNADTEKSLNRFLVLPDDRVWGKNSFLVYEELGLYFHNLKEYGRSLKYYEEYVRLDSTNSRILTLVANAHDDLGHPDSAIAVLRKAIRYDSSNAALFGNLGKLCVEVRRYEEASAAFERQLNLSGGDPEALNSMGALILVWHQDYGSALPYFLRAIAARPELSIAYLNAGICFQQRGDLRQAGVYYAKFIAMDPNHPKARQLREMMGKH